MSTFGNPTMPSNPPFNAVNPSGSNPDQSINTIAQVKQGELNRAHEASVANAQLTQQNQQAFLQRRHEGQMAQRNARVDYLRGEITRKNEDFWRERSERLARDQMRSQRELEIMRMDREEARTLGAEARGVRAKIREGEAAQRAVDEFRPRREELQAERTRAQADMLAGEMLSRFMQGWGAKPFMDESFEVLSSELLGTEMLQRVERDVGSMMDSIYQSPLWKEMISGDRPRSAREYARWLVRDPQGKLAAEGMAEMMVPLVAPGELDQASREQLKEQLQSVIAWNFLYQDSEVSGDQEGMNRSLQQMGLWARSASQTPGVESDALALTLRSMAEWGRGAARGADDQISSDVQDPTNTPYVDSIEGARGRTGTLHQGFAGLDRVFRVRDPGGREYLRDPGNPVETATTLRDAFEKVVTGIAGNPQLARTYLAGARRGVDGGMVADPDFVEAVDEWFQQVQSPLESGEAQEIANKLTTMYVESARALGAGLEPGADPFAGRDLAEVIPQELESERGFAERRAALEAIDEQLEDLTAEQMKAASRFLLEGQEENLRDLTRGTGRGGKGRK